MSRTTFRTTAWIVFLSVILTATLIRFAPAQADNNKESVWRFASMPDFLNTDVADVSSAANWSPNEYHRWVGKGNATHDALEQTIDYMLDQVASEKPRFVLAAGDIVNGEWNRYSEGVGRNVFGPTDTYREQKTAMRRAAKHYYSRWIKRFESRGLTPFPVVGDHELGDNDWPAGSSKARLVPYYRELFSIYFTRNNKGKFRFKNRPKDTPQEGTAYAFQHKNVLVVTVDLHHQEDPEKDISDRGSIEPRLGKGQLQWFRSTLRQANKDESVDFIIVQGHYPVIAEVRHSKASSSITVKDGTDGAFWKTMEKNNVDLYFAGEIHEATTSREGGVIQVVHGGWIAAVPRYVYLLGNVRGKTMKVRLKQFTFQYLGQDGDPLFIWQNEWPHRIPVVDRAYGVRTVGEMTIDKTSGRTKITNQTGDLTFYEGPRKEINPDRTLIPESEVESK